MSKLLKVDNIAVHVNAIKYIRPVKNTTGLCIGWDSGVHNVVCPTYEDAVILAKILINQWEEGIA